MQFTTNQKNNHEIDLQIKAIKKTLKVLKLLNF